MKLHWAEYLPKMRNHHLSTIILCGEFFCWPPWQRDSKEEIHRQFERQPCSLFPLKHLPGHPQGQMAPKGTTMQWGPDQDFSCGCCNRVCLSCIDHMSHEHVCSLRESVPAWSSFPQAKPWNIYMYIYIYIYMSW